MAGRRPQPTKLRILHGNRSKRPLPKGEPQPTIAAPDEPPSILHGVALEKWHSLAPELCRLGILTVLDTALLAVYCCSYARWVEACEAIEREGMTTVTAEGRRLMSPYVSIARDYAATMRQVAIEFGFTPASRPKLAKGETKPDDPLEAFIQKKRR
jgi:P27 family predicted phage terminase small subunit